jgi:2-C-methyl-D-erythritol 2,4-cyclodiphosphate synthase
VRTGIGYDSHRFTRGRKLVLGGVEIPHGEGLSGHSDADALTHAIIDSIIGALGLGDIGRHFPDTDPAWKDARSTHLLERTLALARAEGYEVSWVDATVICERLRLAPHIDHMKTSLKNAGLKDVNIKAKTNEGMGFTGRGEGIAALAVCVLENKQGL